MSAEADPALLLGLTIEHLDEDRGGRITTATRSAVTFTEGGSASNIPAAALTRWVVQDVPQGVARRMMTALPMPPAHVEELQRLGFAVETLTVDDARLVLAVEERVVAGGEVPFEGIERLGGLAAVPGQKLAAVKLLHRCLDHQSRGAAQARLQLARIASQSGDLDGVLRLTDPALSRDADPRIVPRVRAMLLTVRAACIAQLAQTCAQLVEAKRLAGIALAVGGKSEHLSNTYFLIHRRAESLRCKLR